MSSGFDSAWLQQRLLQANKAGVAEPTSIGHEPIEREEQLHREIIDFCNRQFPKWKFRHARMDRKTTEEKGVEDFTVFASQNRTFHFECKAKGKKRTTEQLSWAMEMQMLCHEVHCIESFGQFLNAVSTYPKPPTLETPHHD